MKKYILILFATISFSNSILIFDSMAQWVQLSNGIGTDKEFTCFASIGNNIYAGTFNQGIYLSTNNGVYWTAVNNGMPNYSVSSFAVSGTNLFAGTWGGVFLSTNYGMNWIARNSGLLSTLTVLSLAVSGSNIFKGSMPGLSLSTNDGLNWNLVNCDLLTMQNVNSLAVSGNNIFAGAEGAIFLSTNNGTNWNVINNGFPNYLDVYSIAISGINIFLGTNNGVFLSTNNGANWSSVGFANKVVLSFATSGTSVLAGTDSNGIYLSTNNGTNWVNKNQGFNVLPSVYALTISNGYIFAGTWSNSIWRRPLSEIISVQNISTEIPAQFSLSQNYPNPFNSTSNLKFQISNLSYVKIIVYDIMGREVQTLVNERLQLGTYEVTFDGSTLNSGIYFYRMKTEGFSETKKMLLIK
jgi:photosystem II stability/assembly factor-like uncharacterized protein